jgi:diadenosine tetraphosphate (Ap4A) HIT family hydrolase
LIKRTQHFYVHQDPLIPLPGFLVIASTRHIKSIAEMQGAEYEEFSMLVKTAHDAIKKATEIEFLTIVQEEYSAHLHLWFFPWTPSVIKNYGRPSLTTIRGIMSDYTQTLDAIEWKTLERSIEKIKTLMAY